VTIQEEWNMKSTQKNARTSFSLIMTIAVICLLTAVMIPGVMAFASPAPVNLGSAANFAILTKTGVTDVPPSVVNGDVGSSPITGAATLVSCSEVTGSIYSVDAAGPAPCVVPLSGPILTPAVNDMVTAYVDAAGRPTPDATELYAGNLGGRTLAPGLYKWSNSVLIPTGTTLTLDGGGDPNAVWIFQVAQDLTMDTNSHMALINGAKADNVFWQIGGLTGVTIGTDCTPKGTILGAKAINLGTHATLDGRALAQTAVT
jgi:hypothetical protein